MAKYTEKDVPDTSSYPAGTVQLRVLSVKHSTDAEISSEKPLMIEAKFEILAHTDQSVASGSKYTERFRLGSTDDPRAELAATRKQFKDGRGGDWQRWLAFTKATGTFVGDTEEEAEALDASKPDVVADLTRREGKGASAGKFFNSLDKYYAPGKKSVAPSAPAPSAAPASDKKKCPKCDKLVSAKLFDSHVARHEPEEENEEE